MPGYDHVVETLADADVPLVVVKSTGDAYDDTHRRRPDARDRHEQYLEKGGTANVANCLRFLVDEGTGDDSRSTTTP